MYENLYIESPVNGDVDDFIFANEEWHESER